MVEQFTPESLRASGYPIWYWLSQHNPVDARAVRSLLSDDSPDQRLDGFIACLKSKMPGGCLCISPSCPGCYHSGQDVLLFIHKLSTFLRNSAQVEHPPFEFIKKMAAFSRECRTILAKTVNMIAQSYPERWRFLSFDDWKGSDSHLLNRKNYYRIFTRICKPLLISLARLFFTIFRGFIKYQYHDPSVFKECIEELLLIHASYADLGSASLYEFSLIERDSRVELGLPETSICMHTLHVADQSARRPSAFERVRMPDEIFESALEVFLSRGKYSNNPETLASEIQDQAQISVLCGMGFRRDLLSCLTSLCSDTCNDKVFELITQILSVPLNFRDVSSLLNLDDARDFRGEMGSAFPMTISIIREAKESDTALHARIFSLCQHKFKLILQTPSQDFQHFGDFLDFSKALQSVISLVSDSSSSTFLKLCFGCSFQQESILKYCISLAQFCVNRASDDTFSGTNHAASAFVLASIAVSIAQQQKQGALEDPQISKDCVENFVALNDLGDVGAFHTSLSTLESNSTCRFISSWLLARGGQFFTLFRMHKDLLSRLVPLRQGRMLREIVRFIKREAFQQYVPSACYLWLSSHPTFAQEFVAIFSSQRGLDATCVPRFISPFSQPFGDKADFGGQLVAALFCSDDSLGLHQVAAASIISNVICSDPEAKYMQLIGSVLHQIKSGRNALSCRIAVQTILPVMEHPGLHGVSNQQGGIQGGWYHRDGFFMTLLLGRTRDSPEKTEFLKDLSVFDLLRLLEKPEKLDFSATVFHMNAIFTILILVSRGITKSQSLWRLENPDKQHMISLMFSSNENEASHLICRILNLLPQVHGSSQLLFSLPEMIQVAFAMLSSRCFALRRPLVANEIRQILAAILPLLCSIESECDVTTIAKSIISIVSPEHYIACLDNSRSFESFWGERGHLDRMKEVIYGSFIATLSSFKKLAQANIVVASRVIRLFFDGLKSIFMYYKSSSLLLESSQRPSVFLCEVWPNCVELNAKFSTRDVESFLDILSSKELFSAFWISAISLQDSLKKSFGLSFRLEILHPMHQGLAHVVTFATDKLMTKIHSISYHSPLYDKTRGNKDSRLASQTAVQEAYSQLQQMCSIIIPSIIDEKKYLIVLPVLKEILLQQTSFLSCGSSMFLGAPVLVDGHLFASTHIPYVLGKLKEQARFLACGSYLDHHLFLFGSDDGHALDSKFSPYICRAAALSLFTGMGFDFFGSRSIFLEWLHKVVSCNPCMFAPKHSSFHPRISEFHEKWSAWIDDIPVEHISALLKYFQNALKPTPGTTANTKQLRLGNASMQKLLSSVPRISDFFQDFGWAIELLPGPKDGPPESYFVFKLCEEFLTSACALLDKSYFPDFSSHLQSQLAYDILALLPASAQYNLSTLWDYVKFIGSFECELYFSLDQRGRKRFSTSISRSCSETSNFFNELQLGMSEILLTSQSPQGVDFKKSCTAYFKHVQDLHLFHQQSCEFGSVSTEMAMKFNSIQSKLVEWSKDSAFPAQARCLIFGSFFRIAAFGHVFNFSCISIDPRILQNLCSGYCLWFASADLLHYDTLSRLSDTNTFPSIFLVGLETLRAALHCLMLLPQSLAFLSEGLQALSPLMTLPYKDVIDVVLSTLSKHCRSIISNTSLFSDSQYDHLSSENVLQMFTSIVLNEHGETTEAFHVVLERPSLFLQLCDWLMINHGEKKCGQLLIRLVSEQNFPKVIDISSPRLKISGLVNVGNTCFLSSLFQQLASIPKFISSLRSPVYGPEGLRLIAMEQSRTLVLKDFLLKLCSQQDCLKKEATEDYLRKLGFALDNRQDDPLSALRLIIGWIVAETSDYDHNVHGSLAQMKQTEIDSDVLSRTLVSKIRKHISWTDCACSTQSHEIESVFEGLITLKPHSSGCQSMKCIEEVLTARFIEREDSEQCSCRQGLSSCKVTLEFYDKLPEVLVLGLNAREEYVGSGSSQKKDFRVPTISRELDLNKCAKLDCNIAKGNSVYILNGIILHHGASPFSGHYTSLVRTADSTWVHIDDDHCQRIDPPFIDKILQRDGTELPDADGMSPTYMTGKPSALFYVLKSVSHPCSSVLFDTRLVQCMETVAVSSPSESVSFDALSLCFKLAPLFVHEKDRACRIASVCQRFLTDSEHNSKVSIVDHFHRIASTADPELLFTLCNITSSNSSGSCSTLSKELALCLADDIPNISSKTFYRRFCAVFQIGIKLSPSERIEICSRVCSRIVDLLPPAIVSSEPGEILFPTKAYAALKSISDLPDDSPFLQIVSQDQNFFLAVHHLSRVSAFLPLAAADQKTNLIDDDENCVVSLSRTSTASSVIQKLRDFMQHSGISQSSYPDWR